MKCYCDRFLYISIIIAHFLLYFSFGQTEGFWFVFALSMLILLVIAVIKEKFNFKLPSRDAIIIGFSSGFLLYLLFWVGKFLLDVLNLELINEIGVLYSKVGLTEWWHYLLLFLIVIPAEEVFWRGYIQKRLSFYFGPKKGIIYATLLYASANIYADSTLLIISAIVAGLIWGALYQWKKSLWVTVISHLIFNLMLLVLFPLL